MVQAAWEAAEVLALVTLVQVELGYSMEIHFLLEVLAFRVVHVLLLVPLESLEVASPEPSVLGLSVAFSVQS